MRTAGLKSLIVFGVSLIASVQAHAQPLFPHAESIESTVANADFVVIAKLVDFRGGEQTDEREGHDATIAIEETLKKDVRTAEPYRRLGIYIPRPASVLADWKERSCRTHGDRTGAGPVGSHDGGYHAPARSRSCDQGRQGNSAPYAGRSEANTHL